MAIEFPVATPADVAECLEIRGKTRENAVSAEHQAELGVTESVPVRRGRCGGRSGLRLHGWPAQGALLHRLGEVQLNAIPSY